MAAQIVGWRTKSFSYMQVAVALQPFLLAEKGRVGREVGQEVWIQRRARERSFVIQAFQDLPRLGILDLDMSRHCFHGPVSGIDPERMRRTFPLQVAACGPQAAFQVLPLHSLTPLSWMASSGSPRRISALRSSRIDSIASFKSSLACSTVSPCPLAPGTSGQMAQKPPSGAASMIAVNSAFISFPLRERSRPSARADGPWSGKPLQATSGSPSPLRAGQGCGAPRSHLAELGVPSPTERRFPWDDAPSATLREMNCTLALVISA